MRLLCAGCGTAAQGVLTADWPGVPDDSMPAQRAAVAQITAGQEHGTLQVETDEAHAAIH